MTRLLIFAAMLVLLAPVAAQEPDFKAELPRFPPVEPKDALATMKVQPGFRLDLVAAEPLVASPVAACWDERGRMYVVEMRGYSERRDERLSRIKVLTDTNDDGIYDEAKVFAEPLLWPTAICCWNGGVFVADAPEVWYFKDEDGDDVSDRRKRIYTGFGTQNVQGLVNTLLWGPDNRIHGATSSNGGEITVIGAPPAEGQKPLSLRGRDFSFTPWNTADIRAESGGGQHGMTFDDLGRKFVCSNSDHAQQILLDDRYLTADAWLAAPAPRVSIAADGPQAAVFRASPIEPWRVLRTRLRVEGKVPGPIEGGGRPAGYFTGATGITMIRGNAFPDDVQGTLVVGDVGSNLVHRKRLRQEGRQCVAERIDQESELVASTDTWFRPAQFANGPDGALYIIDVYRETIEHPASLPPAIKKHLDLDSGRDRGRIWRLAPAGFRHKPVRRLDKASVFELVKLLDHPNAWHRETAARLLLERRERATPAVLADLLESPRTSPRGRAGALQLLGTLVQEFGARYHKLHLALLSDPDPRVREQAVRVVAQRLEFVQRDRIRLPLGEFVPIHDLADELNRLAADEDPGVRLQVALSMRVIGISAREEALAKLLEKSVGDPYLQWAVLTAIPVAHEELLLAGVRNAELRHDRTFRPQLLQLAERAGRSWAEGNVARLPRMREEMQELAAALELPRDDLPLMSQLSQTVLRELAKDPLLKDRYPGETVPRLQRLRAAGETAALETATDAGRDLRVRLDAMPLLAGLDPAAREKAIGTLLAAGQPTEIQLAALELADPLPAARGTEIVLAAWPSLSPAIRRAAGALLVRRPERCQRLLDAIEGEKFPAAELDPTQTELLRNHSTAALRDRARKLLANLTLAKRQEVVDGYRGALDAKGDATRGKAAFAKHCSACHRLENVGSETGPNLAAMKSRGVEAILLNVLDPNREVNPQYLSYVLTTKDGRIFAGMISGETAASVTLRRADGKSETILRDQIEELRGTGKSLMPEGMEKQLDQAAMADLLAYLMQVK